jgi:1,4-dihydroxy-2-naphthoate octaprenyltransferase
VLNLNNMRDVDNDLAHKKYTTAYYFGFRGAKIYQAVLVLLPYALIYWVARCYIGPVNALFCLIPLPLSLVQVIRIMKVTERKQFDQFLKFQALITFLNSLVLFICLSLLHA